MRPRGGGHSIQLQCGAIEAFHRGKFHQISAFHCRSPASNPMGCTIPPTDGLEFVSPGRRRNVVPRSRRRFGVFRSIPAIRPRVSRVHMHSVNHNPHDHVNPFSNGLSDDRLHESTDAGGDFGHEHDSGGGCRPSESSSPSRSRHWLKKHGCSFETHKGGSGHLTVRRGDRTSQLPMHGSRRELGTKLIAKIKKDLGL